MQPLPRLYKRTASVDHRSPAEGGPMFPAVSLDRTHTDDNTDTLTQATVHKMCALIRDSANDPLVQQCAAYAAKHFACASSDPAALAWGVFWYVKHCVKFRSDEGTMMQVGERALDLLTAPAVLVRMKDPSEDCDGFTMLSAAMLTILGVPVLVTTVAVDLDDPRRWSHVFLCAVINGRVVPLDTSHGKAPGWMVPKSRIHRWQTWKLDGTPANVSMPTNHGLHGYTRGGMGQTNWGGPPPINPGIPRTMNGGPIFGNGGRPIFGGGVRPQPVRVPMPILRIPKRNGMGQAGCATAVCNDVADDGSCIEWDDSSCMSPGATTDTPQAACLSSGGGWNGTGCVMPTIPLNTPLTPTQAGLTPAQQAALIAATGNSAVSLIRTATGGPYVIAGTNNVYNPATGQITLASNPYGVNMTALSASITSNLPLILGGLAAIFILPSLLGGKR